MALWIVDIQPAKRLALEGEPIVEVIREAGHEVAETVYDPASGGFPNDLDSIFAAARPLILRGSVGFAAWAHAHWPISPGAFRSERLRPSAYLPAYGELALNSDAIITTYAEFERRRTEFEFIADIAETENGFQLLELNTFGTAGLYECDLKAIVQAVSVYAS